MKKPEQTINTENKDSNEKNRKTNTEKKKDTKEDKNVKKNKTENKGGEENKEIKKRDKESKKKGKEGTNKPKGNKSLRKKSKIYFRRQYDQELNGYFLTKKVRHKHLIKLQSFSGTKVSCMVDHVKPTLRDEKPNHIILHIGTNDLCTEKAASQIAKSIMDVTT